MAPLHTVVFSGSVNAPLPGTAAAVITPSTTDSYCQTDSTAITPPHDMQLIAAFCCSTAIQTAQVVSPSRPVNQSIPALLAYASPDINVQEVGVANFTERPLRLPGGEGFSVKANTSGAATTNAVLILAFGAAKIPPGEALMIRFYKSVSSGSAVWKLLGLVASDYSVTLPSGTYALIGMDYFSLLGLAARAVLEGVRYRPGVVAHGTINTRSHEMFTKGQLGVWGYFSSRSMPDIEVFCATSESTHTGYLYVVRVGDVDMLPLLTGKS